MDLTYKEDSDQLLKDGDIALEAALENTRVSQDLFNPVINWLADDSNKEDSDQLLKDGGCSLKTLG